MGLADLFRPKHKHSDPDVRLEAIRHLGDGDGEILAQLARGDAARQVRKAAIERLEDPVRLVEVAAREPDSGLRELAESRARVRLARWAESEQPDRALTAIRQIAQLEHGGRALVVIARRAQLAEVRRAAVESLRTDRELADVARSGADTELRVFALGRIESPEILRSVAVDEHRKEVGFAVVERLEDAESLAHVASKGKNRLVRARASRKLSSQTPVSAKSSEEKRAHAERAQLCRQAESLARTDSWEGKAETLAELREAWQALAAEGPAPDPELEARFVRACRRFDERYEREGRAALAASERAKAEASVGSEDSAPARGDDEDATARATDADPSEQGAPSADTGTGSEAAGDAGEQGDGDDSGAGREDATHAGSDAKNEPAARAAGKARAEREKRATEALAALESLVSELEGELDTDSIKHGDRALQRAQSRYRKLSALPGSNEARALDARYEEARRKLLIRLRELREAEEWKRWASVGKKEELIQRAEKLLRAEDEPELFDKLKALQSDWKQSGPAPKDKNDVLWSQFKATCDQIYERVKARRAEQAAGEKQNLEKKEALVTRAEELAESTDWERTAEEIKRLQREWKEIGPVPKKRAGSLWKRFRAACDRFFERRKPHLEKRLAELQEHLEAKQSIVASIEALAEASDDWSHTEQELKRLRSEFRKIGPVPRKEADALGERFRAACDRVSASQAQAREARATSLLEQGDAAASRIEARLAGDDPGEGDAAADAMALRATLRELEAMGAGGTDELKARAEDVTRRAMEAFGDAFRGTDLDPEAIVKKRRKLCERAEALIPEAPESPRADASPEEVAAALKAALAERALGVHQDGERSVADECADLREQWRRLGPAPGAEAEELEARFQAACERAEGAASEAAADGGAGAARAEPS